MAQAGSFPAPYPAVGAQTPAPAAYAGYPQQYGAPMAASAPPPPAPAAAAYTGAPYPANSMPPATAVDKYDDPFAVGPALPGHQPNTYTLGTGPMCCGCGIQLTL